MENLKPNGKLAEKAIILMWIVLVLEVVNIFSCYMQYDLLNAIAWNEFITTEEAEANYTRVIILGGIYLVVFIISAITFLMWFAKAYSNLHKKVNNLAYSKGWAVGSWFVPILNIYRPYKIMKEIYVETKKLFEQRGISEKFNYSMSYLVWWWVLWLISKVFGLLASKMPADTIDNLITNTVANIIFLLIIRIPLALVTIKVIKDYAKIEPLLTEIDDKEPSIFE